MEWRLTGIFGVIFAYGDCGYDIELNRRLGGRESGGVIRRRRVWARRVVPGFTVLFWTREEEKVKKKGQWKKRNKKLMNKPRERGWISYEGENACRH